MRYLRARDGAFMEWLRSELPGAVAVTAASRDADASGVALIEDAMRAFLDRGGGLRVLVATAKAATAARSVLEGPGRDVVVSVTGGDGPGVAAYVLTSADGLHRAYLGGTTWTGTSLLGACPAVLFDLRRDSPAAERLLADVTMPGDVDSPEPAVAALEDLLQSAMTALEAVSGTRSLRTGVVTPGRRGTPTGLTDLDALTGGVWPGDLWVLTGRTGAGKSVLALDVTRAAAIGQRAPSVLLLGRHDQRDAVTRLLSAEARVPLHRLRLGTLTDDDWARLARRMGEIGDNPLHLAREGTDARPATPDELVAAAVRIVRRLDVRVLVVDDMAARTTGDHLRKLKELAARERVAVLVVFDDSPDRAAAEAEASRRADVVIRVDRDHETDNGGRATSARAGEADLFVLRHRRGPVGVVTAAFEGHYSRFVDLPPA